MTYREQSSAGRSKASSCRFVSSETALLDTMPAIAPNADALVLVTGSNGYIAVHLVRVLLEKGYRVRGTVRKQAAIPYLKNMFTSRSDKLEFVVVPDINVVRSSVVARSYIRLILCRTARSPRRYTASMRLGMSHRP